MAVAVLFGEQKSAEQVNCVVSSVHQACPLYPCAVTRRRFPVGANPTRRTLQPEATGAVMEVTKWLKPSDSVSRNTVTARECAGRNASERRANLILCRK